MGRLSANLQLTRKSYVCILQRMHKPGSFASCSCTLGERLRARPKDFLLPRKEPTAVSHSCYLCSVFRILAAAKPLIA